MICLQRESEGIVYYTIQCNRSSLIVDNRRDNQLYVKCAESVSQ